MKFPKEYIAIRGRVFPIGENTTDPHEVSDLMAEALNTEDMRKMAITPGLKMSTARMRSEALFKYAFAHR